MEKSEFFGLIEEMLELEPKSIHGGTSFRDLPGWDSMAVLNFIALVDEQFNLPVNPKDLASCTTIADLTRFAGDQVE